MQWKHSINLSRHALCETVQNVWFWECEDRPVGTDWDKSELSDRVYWYIRRIVQFLESGSLPQYFIPDDDLLDGKDKEQLHQTCQDIKQFLDDPPEL